MTEPEPNEDGSRRIATSFRASLGTVV